MIASLIRYMWRIANWQRIPPLPRMLAAMYDDVDSPERRVMARMGSRDPRGVKRAMARHRAKNLNHLVQMLEHYRARRDMARRADLMAGRITGGTRHHPHRRDTGAERRAQRARPYDVRLRRAVRMLKDHPPRPE